jgi:hypothetical protein
MSARRGEARHLKPNSPKWARLGGWRLRVYENSLLIAMGVLFFLPWFAMAVAQHNVYDANQASHHQAAVSLLGFLGTSYFWNEGSKTGGRNSSQ